MICSCEICEKEFDVLHPDLWRYKRGTTYFCSWRCMRINDEEMNGKMKLTKEQREKAVQMALEGKSPLPYIQECGVNNPSCSWYSIKAYLKRTDPGRLAKVNAALYPGKKPETPEEHMRVPAEIPEDAAPCDPPFEYKTIGISTAVGEFRYDKRHGYIDWDPLDNSDTVSLQVAEWDEFMKIWPHVLKVLEVKE